MSRPLWFVYLLKKSFPFASQAARLTHLPGIGSLAEKSLFDGDDITFLAKDRVIEINKDVETGQDMVLPSMVVDHFINKANFIWIMDSCICRDGKSCTDYPVDYGCLFLGEAAMGINPKLGRQASKEEALEHARKCREAGLVHLIGRNKLDVVWLNVKPGNKLLTICNCCPCCCLWRIIPDIIPEIGDKVTKMPGVSVSVQDQCIGCGACTADICFVKAIEIVNGKSVISSTCRGCGRCVEICPHGSIRLTIDNDQFVAKSIEHISGLVDVT